MFPVCKESTHILSFFFYICAGIKCQTGQKNISVKEKKIFSSWWLRFFGVVFFFQQICVIQWLELKPSAYLLLWAGWVGEVLAGHLYRLVGSWKLALVDHTRSAWLRSWVRNTYKVCRLGEWKGGRERMSKGSVVFTSLHSLAP